MKKFLTLLSAAFIAVVSLATVASADEYKPTVALDVVAVLPNGNAIVNAAINVEKDFDFVNSGNEYYDFVNGTAITAWQIDLNANEEIFAQGSAQVIGNYGFDFSKVLTSKDKVVTLGTAIVALKDAYKAKTVAELNALNFAEVKFAAFTVSTWKDAMDAKKAETIVSVTEYRSDGLGESIKFDLSATRIGTYVPGGEGDDEDEPTDFGDYTLTAKKPAADAWKEATGKNAVYWGVKFDEGKFADYSKAVFTAGEDSKELTFWTEDDFVINGEVEFAVYVIADQSILDVVDVAISK